MSVVTDALAQELEGKKLWRRAAARWLALTGSGAWSDEELDWIRRRRNYCHAMIVRADDEKLDIAAVNRAAGQTLKRMGISRPCGIAFRSPVQSVADDIVTAAESLRWRDNSDLFPEVK